MGRPGLKRSGILFVHGDLGTSELLDVLGRANRVQIAMGYYNQLNLSWVYRKTADSLPDSFIDIIIRQECRRGNSAMGHIDEI
jgi:hypothetical protein